MKIEKCEDLKIYTSALSTIARVAIWALHTHRFLFSVLVIKVQIDARDFSVTVTQLERQERGKRDKIVIHIFLLENYEGPIFEHSLCLDRKYYFSLDSNKV